jgi:hypothetical protein
MAPSTRRPVGPLSELSQMRLAAQCEARICEPLDQWLRRGARERRTQTDMGVELGVSQRTVGHWLGLLGLRPTQIRARALRRRVAA